MGSTNQPQVEAEINHVEHRADLFWTIPDFMRWTQSSQLDSLKHRAV